MYYAFFLLAQADKAAPKAGEPSNFWEALAQSPLPMFALIAVLFWLLLIRPQRNRERQQREQLNKNLKKNDRVVTNAGIIGTVANIKDDEVTLKLEEGRVRILKSTIARILSAEEPSKEAKAESAK
jgi:preprotein translocase subunit YajC